MPVLVCVWNTLVNKNLVNLSGHFQSSVSPSAFNSFSNQGMQHCSRRGTKKKSVLRMWILPGIDFCFVSQCHNLKSYSLNTSQSTDSASSTARLSYFCSSFKTLLCLVHSDRSPYFPQITLATSPFGSLHPKKVIMVACLSFRSYFKIYLRVLYHKSQ